MSSPDVDLEAEARTDSTAEPEHDPASARAAAITAVVLATMALLVGLVNIGRSFNFDEAITYGSFINGGSVRRALTTQIAFNNHQMFSVFQTVGWRLGFVGESSQRLGPVVCGVVTVGALTWATARRAGVIGGATAGVVLLLNPVYLAEFRSLRGYSLATMCIVLAALAVHRSWNDRRPVWLVAQAAAMVVAVATHAYSALAILLIAVYTLAVGRLRPAHLVAWSGAAVAALVIQLPVLDETITATRANGSLFQPEFVERAARFLLGQAWPAVAITAALAVIGAWSLARRSRPDAIAVVACSATFVAFVLTIWLVLQPLQLFARFFVGVIPFLAAAAGLGAARLPRAVGAVALMVLVVSLVPDARQTLQRDSGLRDAAIAVDAAREQGLVVCGYQAEALFVYMAPIRPVGGVDDFEDCEFYVSVLSLRPEAREAATARFEARRRVGGGPILWGPEDVLAELVADG